MASDFDDMMLDYKLDATIAKIELEAVLEGAPATVTCCREWAVLPCWGNPQSVGLQHDDAPVVRIGPGEQCHCPDCGARFTLTEDGTVEVGPPEAKLLAENERLRAALMPLETSSIASAVQEAVAARRPQMTRDELMALRRTCVVCGGTGRARGEGSPDYAAAVWVTCRTCLGTGYVMPATEQVLGLVDTADFWRAVALKAAAATDYDYPMDWDAKQRLAAIADEVRAALRKAEEATDHA